MPRTGTGAALGAINLLPTVWAGSCTAIVGWQMPRTVIVTGSVGRGNWAARRLCVAVATGLAFFPASATARRAVVVVLDADSALAGVAVLVLSPSSSAECIELGVDRGLRLDEAATIVTHWLIACVWVLGSDCDNRSN